MKIRVIGTALIVTSDITKDLYDQAITYAPKTLTTVDEDGNDVFVAAVGNTAHFSKNGTIFNGTTEEGNLTATLVIPQQDSQEATKEYVKKTFGNAIATLSLEEPVIINAINAHLDVIGSAFDDMQVE